MISTKMKKNKTNTQQRKINKTYLQQGMKGYWGGG